MNLCVFMPISDSVAVPVKVPLRYFSSTLSAVIKCGDIDLSRVCEEENKQGGKLKAGLMLCRLMTRLRVLCGTGLSGSKPRIHCYEFSVLWREPGWREGRREDQ